MQPPLWHFRLRHSTSHTFPSVSLAAFTSHASAGESLWLSELFGSFEAELKFAPHPPTHICSPVEKVPETQRSYVQHPLPKILTPKALWNLFDCFISKYKIFGPACFFILNADRYSTTIFQMTRKWRGHFLNGQDLLGLEWPDAKKKSGFPGI